MADKHFDGQPSLIQCRTCGMQVEANAAAKKEHADWHTEMEKPPPPAEDVPAEG